MKFDERFPKWCKDSQYASIIYSRWERETSFRSDCDLAQREPMFRKNIEAWAEEIANR